jgi:hypothetical protein
MTSLLNDPGYWRERAGELRAMAETMKDPDAKGQWFLDALVTMICSRSGLKNAWQEIQADKLGHAKRFPLASHTVQRTICPELFQVRIENHPSMAVTTWAPASEIAKAEDIADMRPTRRGSGVDASSRYRKRASRWP